MQGRGSDAQGLQKETPRSTAGCRLAQRRLDCSGTQNTQPMQPMISSCIGGGCPHFSATALQQQKNGP